jgi:hypothetical protein
VICNLERTTNPLFQQAEIRLDIEAGRKVCSKRPPAHIEPIIIVTTDVAWPPARARFAGTG